MKHGDEIINPRTMEKFVYKVLDEDDAFLISLTGGTRFYIRKAKNIELELLHRANSGICVVEGEE